mgnify:FL=1
MSRLTELYDIYKKQGTAQRDADVAASDKMYDTQRRQTQDTYDRQIKDTNNSYEDMYRENAVQRLINERKIAEDMAGLGLTDSGLNRTQQTAVQLSYANSKNKIDTNRQKAVDTLAASLADAVSRIDANKLAAAEKIRGSYESSWNSAAQSTYAKELEEQTKRVEANIKAQKEQIAKQQKANYIIQTNGGTLRRSFTGSLKDNNVSVIYDKTNKTTTYIDNNSGKKTTVASSVNPYTGNDNSELIEEFGAFDNGYQPRGVRGHGKLLRSVGKDAINGNMQNIFEAADASLWIWDGSINEYRMVDINGDGESNIKDLIALRKKNTQ